MRGIVLRYLAFALVGLAGLVGLTLLVRPLIYSVAPPRDDSVYAVASTQAVGVTPIVREVLINQRHGLLGERAQGEHAAIWLAISRSLTGAYVVANAWSPVSDCQLTLSGDRLRDCAGHAWTFDGDPFDPADPALQRFPVTVESGALIADLTRPVDASPAHP